MQDATRCCLANAVSAISDGRCAVKRTAHLPSLASVFPFAATPCIVRVEVEMRRSRTFVILGVLGRAVVVLRPTANIYAGTLAVLLVGVSDSSPSKSTTRGLSAHAITTQLVCDTAEFTLKRALKRTLLTKTRWQTREPRTS